MNRVTDFMGDRSLFVQLITVSLTVGVLGGGAVMLVRGEVQPALVAGAVISSAVFVIFGFFVARNHRK